MGRFISIERTEKAALSLTALPFVWKPRDVEPRFVKVAVPVPTVTPELTITAPQQDIMPPTPVPTVTPTPDPVVMSPVADMTVSTLTLPVADMNVSMYTLAPMATLPVPEPPTPVTSPAQVENVAPRTPLSQNLLSIRRRLNLTPEEFSRPIIEDGEGLINRLEAGFSRPSAEISNLICDTWGITTSYLFSGTGPMFLKDETESTEKYIALLTRLLRTYLDVATFDKRGNQYWKGSLVDDLIRIVEVGRLDGRNMSRVVRVLFDYLDTEQFEIILERFGL